MQILTLLSFEKHYAELREIERYLTPSYKKTQYNNSNFINNTEAPPKRVR